MPFLGIEKGNMLSVSVNLDPNHGLHSTYNL